VTHDGNRAATARVRAFFETLGPASIDRMDAVYAPDASFRDPFNDVRGLAEIRRIFAQMFEHLDDCRFTFIDETVDEHGAFLTWDMTFRIRRLSPGETRRIHGATQLKFAPDGRVACHRDYWDAADELYAKLPLIGPVMRWLKRKLG
jgi:ketosteroid isomerase-like protein